MATGEDVYCTLVMSDAYLPGAAVLSKSLRDTGTTKMLACLIDQERLRASTITELQSLYNYTIPIERIGNPNPANLYLMDRPDLLYTFTKIHIWRMVQFRKIVFVDSDVVALRAPDELFDIQENFAAAPDVGWPDAFNTGVMVVSPHAGDYSALRTLAGAGDSFDGADQGLLNQYFEHKPWKRLSFAYNCTPSASYQYEPAYRYYKRDISMVHFIGSQKPWQQGRTVKGASGAYQELLSRWWAVYDRHFQVSTSEYISGQRERLSHAMQQEVGSEAQSGIHGYYATGYPVESTFPTPPPAPPPTTQPTAPFAPPPEASAIATAKPFSEPGENAENIDQGIVEPRQTAEVRRFSAPHMEWDATRNAPPPESKPEAANFPTAVYEFSTDTAPFRPPISFHEPPKVAGVQVPKERPRKEEKLAPIFPWEEREVPKPARRFVEDDPLPPPLPQPQEPELEPEAANADEFEGLSDVEKVEPRTPKFQIQDRTSWDAFGATSKNAWDEVSGIEDYIRALTAFQKNRGKVQVLQNQVPPQSEQAHILSPTNEPKAEELLEKVRERRESLILTDFPSAVERPSLPVTPAPVRRSSFWGGERDEQGDLPPAEGVPDQADWDPSAQLEQLRRNSLIGPGDLKLAPKKTIPNRDMPSTAIVPEETLDPPQVLTNDEGSLHVLEGSKPPTTQISTENNAATALSEPGIGAPGSSSKQEPVLSSTEQAIDSAAS